MTTITIGLSDGEQRRMTGELYISLVDGCLAVMREGVGCRVVMAYAPGEWYWVEREDGND